MLKFAQKIKPSLASKDLGCQTSENIEKAGREYKEQGRISDELQSYLESLLIPAEVYVRQANDSFDDLVD